MSVLFVVRLDRRQHNTAYCIAAAGGPWWLSPEKAASNEESVEGAIFFAKAIRAITSH